MTTGMRPKGDGWMQWESTYSPPPMNERDLLCILTALYFPQWSKWDITKNGNKGINTGKAMKWAMSMANDTLHLADVNYEEVEEEAQEAEEGVDNYKVESNIFESELK